MQPRFLVDTSALARTDRPAVRDRIARVLAAGLGATCGVVALEWLYSARAKDLEQRLRDLERAFTRVDIREDDFAFAQGVMLDLATRGQHRAVGVADLLIAACARRSGLIVMHYDADFDAISAVTGQRIEWVVPRGSVP